MRSFTETRSNTPTVLGTDDRVKKDCDSSRYVRVVVYASGRSQFMPTPVVNLHDDANVPNNERGQVTLMALNKKRSVDGHRERGI